MQHPSEVSTLRLPIRPVAAACLALLVTFASVAPAFAGKLQDKQAEAARVQKQVAALTTKAEQAKEAYGVAKSRYDALTVKVKTTARTIRHLQAHQNTLQAALNYRADHMYRSGGDLGMIGPLLSSRSLAEFSFTLQALSDIADSNAATVAQVRQAKAEAKAAHHTLVAAQIQAARQKTAMASNAAAVRLHLAQTNRVLAGVQSDIKRIIAQQQAAAEAAARARYMSFLSRADNSGGGGGGLWIGGGNPPTSSKGAAAVWWAEKALGRPYVWAATGPNAFDCSGLTMWAYSKVGISLPHYSRAQYSAGPHVGRQHLQPGDLVFFGSPIHHVGMYIGGGQFIEAPHSGADVRISSLGNRGDFAGACRP
jgi:cell wall-associated NlpC family hydrolase